MFSELGPILSLGITAGLCIAFGILGGWYIDGLLGTTPYITGAGILFGIAAAVYESYKVLKEGLKRFDDRKHDKGK